MKLRHAFFEGAGEIRGEYAGEPLAEETGFAAVAIAIGAVQINEAAGVHHLAFVAGVFLRAPGENLSQCTCKK